VITYQPSELIEFLVVKGTDTVERIEITLEEDSGATVLTWDSICIAYSDAGLARQSEYSSSRLQEFLVYVADNLSRYLSSSSAEGSAADSPERQEDPDSRAESGTPG
jgi:hypothetical protein